MPDSHNTGSYYSSETQYLSRIFDACWWSSDSTTHPQYEKFQSSNAKTVRVEWRILLLLVLNMRREAHASRAPPSSQVSEIILSSSCAADQRNSNRWFETRLVLDSQRILTHYYKHYQVTANLSQNSIQSICNSDTQDLNRIFDTAAMHLGLRI